MYIYICIYNNIYNIICNIRGINILYPWIRDSICGNGDSYSNATFSTVGSVLRVSDAPLSLQLVSERRSRGQIPSRAVLT